MAAIASLVLCEQLGRLYSHLGAVEDSMDYLIDHSPKKCYQPEWFASARWSRGMILAARGPGSNPGRAHLSSSVQHCRRAGQFACPSRLKVAGNITPNPSNVNLKKERPVCISFIFEGHGDHYFAIIINYGVMLLLGVESLIVGSTTGVPMSPGPVKLWRRADVGCCPEILHTEALEYYTTIYAAARCITKEPEYYITHPQQRLICMSFTLEGRGDHYENLSMRWCKLTLAPCCCLVLYR
ncbi:hypothetical protein DAPPUDRAFT_239223 [Daphnia pulex]|uniref:Uncharacterized protein n=1 Tax=Daphnia pulex TaxID=6669 RepID=E9G8P0_DAPPU|nr:hypothetical protein DAPPUDRAFT_239223 [Daphnia pulex]|eukprot:EFX84006.1 hypothetical protein DAPPUDRAFT_239223 [Daphnia pulex]